MAIEHKTLPVGGVQFHPESLMSLGGEVGLRIVENAFRLGVGLNARCTVIPGCVRRSNPDPELLRIASGSMLRTPRNDRLKRENTDDF